MTSRPQTPLLDTVDIPEDLRKLDRSQLRQLPTASIISAWSS